MLIQFRELDSKEGKEKFLGLQLLVKNFWCVYIAQGERLASSALNRVDERLELVSSPPLQENSGQTHLTVLYSSLGALPLANWVASMAPQQLRVRVGRPEGGHKEALETAMEHTGVNLASSRVRVGFSRGHLLEIVIQIPLDVSGTIEELQVASEIYLEERLGDGVLDMWVASISVDRIARSTGLMMVSDVALSSLHHALYEVLGLVTRAAQGVQGELPLSIFEESWGESWTALEIPEMQQGLQADRLFASTCFPEALKSALEGLPFRSERFTRGPEKFIWLRWRSGLQGQARLAQRRGMETRAREQPAASCLLAGTGFGKHYDYLDLWTLPEAHKLANLIEVFSEEGINDIELGFYDSIWAGEVLQSWRTPVLVSEGENIR